MAVSAFAADPKIESAVKVFKQTGEDPAKVKIYCAMSDVTEAAGDKEDPATDAKVDDFLTQLGPDFETAWDTADEAKEGSPDAKMIETALDELGSKCPEDDKQ